MWVLIYKRHLLHLWLMDCYESELINLQGFIEYLSGKKKKKECLHGCQVTASARKAEDGWARVLLSWGWGVMSSRENSKMGDEYLQVEWILAAVRCPGQCLAKRRALAKPGYTHMEVPVL